MQFSVLALTESTDYDQDCKDRQMLVIFSQFVHLMLHRFGIFDFVGLTRGQSVNLESAWTYQPTNDRASYLILLDDLLHTLIVMVTELPSPPPVKPSDEVENAKMRLRRELTHRLASGPKTNSELGEVVHMLSMRDNEILLNEGKQINPDDAIGSSIQEILKDIATCTPRGGNVPDEYQLNKNSWNEYDPAFFHISSVHHQVASDNKPSPEISSSAHTNLPKPYSPFLPSANRFFSRLRMDLASDATIIAIIYRILHVHLSPRVQRTDTPDKPVSSSKPCINILFDRNVSEYYTLKLSYSVENMSESVLCRALQILTLGAHVWSESSDALDYVLMNEGSVFFHHDFARRPSFSDWIDCVLLRDPGQIMSSEAFKGEDSILVLLSRLGRGIELPGIVAIRDKSLRSGAAWLCKLASEYNVDAASILCQSDESTWNEQNESTNNKSMENRMNEAKQRILNKMKADIEKFTSVAEAYDLFDEDADGDPLLSKDEKKSPMASSQTPDFQVHDDFSIKPMTNGIDESNNSMSVTSNESRSLSVNELPRCVICAEDDHRQDITYGKTLSFCAFVQPSTVLLGTGVVASEERDEFDRFVGMHISLCGHAVHSSCCEAYLKALTQREDRTSDRFDNVRKSEFKCPLCQRLSNCLVPLVDADMEWEESEVIPNKGFEYQSQNIEDFLRYSKWWCIRNDKSVTWDGRCSFIPSVDAPSSPKRNSGKVELYRAWDVLLSPYRALRNKRVRPKSESEGYNDALEENCDSIAMAMNDVSDTSATNVWRRLIDIVSDMSYRTDLKRLGENELARNFGEFRHYLVEKLVYNTALEGKAQLEVRCFPSYEHFAFLMSLIY